MSNKEYENLDEIIESVIPIYRNSIIENKILQNEKVDKSKLTKEEYELIEKDTLNQYQRLKKHLYKLFIDTKKTQYLNRTMVFGKTKQLSNYIVNFFNSLNNISISDLYGFNELSKETREKLLTHKDYTNKLFKEVIEELNNVKKKEDSLNNRNLQIQKKQLIEKIKSIKEENQETYSEKKNN